MPTQSYSTNNLPELITRLAETSDIILLGDTDHAASLIPRTVYAPEVLDAMGHAGVKHLVLEGGTDTTEAFVEASIERLKNGQSIHDEASKAAAKIFDVVPKRISPAAEDAYTNSFLDLIEASYRNGIKLHFRSYAPEKALAFLKANPELGVIDNKIHELQANGGNKAVSDYLASLSPRQTVLREKYTKMLIAERTQINPKLAEYINGLDGKVATLYGMGHFDGPKSVIRYLKKPSSLISIIGSDSANIRKSIQGVASYFKYDARTGAVNDDVAPFPNRQMKLAEEKIAKGGGEESRRQFAELDRVLTSNKFQRHGMAAQDIRIEISKAITSITGLSVNPERYSADVVNQLKPIYEHLKQSGLAEAPEITKQLQQFENTLTTKYAENYHRYDYEHMKPETDVMVKIAKESLAKNGNPELTRQFGEIEKILSGENAWRYGADGQEIRAAVARATLYATAGDVPVQDALKRFDAAREAIENSNIPLEVKQKLSPQLDSLRGSVTESQTQIKQAELEHRKVAAEPAAKTNTQSLPAEAKPVPSKAASSPRGEGTTPLKTIAQENAAAQAASPQSKTSTAGAKFNGVNNGIGIAAIAINAADAVINGDKEKLAELGGTVAAVTGVTKGAGILLGAKAVPVVGQIVGGGFAAKDSYDSFSNGNTTRGIVTGIETALYSAAGYSGIVAAGANIWNPFVSIPAGTVALVTGGIAVTITGAKTAYDNWNTVSGWFGYGAGENAPATAQGAKAANAATLTDAKTPAAERQPSAQHASDATDITPQARTGSRRFAFLRTAHTIDVAPASPNEPAKEQGGATTLPQRVAAKPAIAPAHG